MPINLIGVSDKGEVSLIPYSPSENPTPPQEPNLPEPQPMKSMTVFDFGVKADGSDDSAALSKALQYAMDNEVVIGLPSAHYIVKNPIYASSKKNIVRNWGLMGTGSIISQMTDPSKDIMTLDIRHIVRFCRLADFTIKGTQKEGVGLKLLCDQGGNFYCNSLSDLVVEQTGKDCVVVQGAFFESTLLNLRTLDSKNGSGLLIQHSNNRDASSIDVIGIQSHQNGKCGVETNNLQNPNAAAYQVRFTGGYARDNKSYGMFLRNGTAPGYAINGMGFENNCRETVVGNPEGAHVRADTRVTMIACQGHTMVSGSTYLLRGFFTNLATLISCASSSAGAAKESGKVGLCYLDGLSGSKALTIACEGRVDKKPGTLLQHNSL